MMVLGICIFWVMILSICFAMHHKKKMKKCVISFGKCMQVILFTLLSICSYGILFLISYLCDCCNVMFPDIFVAMSLIFLWMSSNKLFRCLCCKKSELTQQDKNMCNTVGIIGLIAFGLIMWIQEVDLGYSKICSVALAVWLGTYISINTIQKDKLIEELKKGFKDSFGKPNIGTVTVSTTITAASVTVYGLQIFSSLKNALEDIMYGLVVGAFSFFILYPFMRKIRIDNKHNFEK